MPIDAAWHPISLGHRTIGQRGLKASSSRNVALGRLARISWPTACHCD
jgi:hypothetical protein